jgi:hypothetical protein
MAATQIWRAPRVRAVDDGEPAASGRGGRGRRAGLRLWTLLRAQGLINGTAGSRDDVALIEDDRARMAGWRRN